MNVYCRVSDSVFNDVFAGARGDVYNVVVTFQCFERFYFCSFLIEFIMVRLILCPSYVRNQVAIYYPAKFYQDRFTGLARLM